MIHFTIPGPPMGEPRKRAAVIAGRARLYTPQKASAYRGLVQWHAQAAWPSAPIIGPVAVRIVCWFALPKTKWRKRETVAAA